jgi:hypothetical protein
VIKQSARNQLNMQYRFKQVTNIRRFNAGEAEQQRETCALFRNTLDQ